MTSDDKLRTLGVVYTADNHIYWDTDNSLPRLCKITQSNLGGTSSIEVVANFNDAASQPSLTDDITGTGDLRSYGVCLVNRPYGVLVGLRDEGNQSLDTIPQ